MKRVRYFLGAASCLFGLWGSIVSCAWSFQQHWSDIHDPVRMANVISAGWGGSLGFFGFGAMIVVFITMGCTE